MDGEYISAELAERTQYDEIRDAYDSNDLSVIVYDGVWCFEGVVDGRVRELVKEEMERLYPQYTYIYYLPYRKERV